MLITKAVAVSWAVVCSVFMLFVGYVMFRPNQDKRLDKATLRIKADKAVDFVKVSWRVILDSVSDPFEQTNKQEVQEYTEANTAQAV